MPGLSSRTSVTRAKRRAIGMRASETILFESEIETLDSIKERLGLASRSDAIRLLIAKTDPNTLTQDDIAVLNKSAA